MSSWVDKKEKIKLDHSEVLEFVGEMGVAGVFDGKLPNGEPYLWHKRKNTKDTKYKGRRK